MLQHHTSVMSQNSFKNYSNMVEDPDLKAINSVGFSGVGKNGGDDMFAKKAKHPA